MPFRSLTAAVAAFAGLPTVPALADATVLPAGYQAAPGTAVFNGILGTPQRTYMWLIHSDQLASMVGHDLTGIAFRMSPASIDAWPAAGVDITSFDLRFGAGVAPADRNLASIGANAAGPLTLVRSGPLHIDAGAYTVAPAAPHPFGPRVAFDTPWAYAGGHLLIELRYTGFSGTTRNVDAVGTSAATGYGSQFSALWASGYAASGSGTQGNFVIIELSSTPGGPPGCYANCDQSTAAPVLNVADFTCFLTKFAGADPYANCDSSTAEPVLNVADFTCFLTRFAAGCP